MAKDRDDSQRHEDQDFPLIPEDDTLGEIDEEVIPLEEDSGSAVNLGEPAPAGEGGSGGSVQSWASLVEEIDEPSHADMGPEEEATMAEEGEEVEEVVELVEDSSVVLGEAVPEVVEGTGSSVVNLGEEVSLEPEVVADVSESGLIFDEGVEPEVVETVGESGVSLDEGIEPEVVADGAHLPVPGAAGADEPEGILLGDEPDLKGGSSSGMMFGEDQLSLEDSAAPTLEAAPLGSHRGEEEEAEEDSFLLATAGHEALEPEQAGSQPEEPDVFHFADEPAETIPGEESGVRLEGPTPAPVSAEDSSSRFEEMMLEEEAGGAGEAEPLAAEVEGDALELADLVEPELPSMSLETVGDAGEGDELPLESIEDRAQDEVVFDGSEDLDVEEVVQTESGSSMQLGSEVRGETPSGRDLIAEAVESGTGLDEPIPELIEPAEEEPAVAAGDEEMTLGVEEEEVSFDAVAEEGESSVDLGDPGGASLEEMALPMPDSASGVELEADDFEGEVVVTEAAASSVELESEEVEVGADSLFEGAEDEVEVTSADALDHEPAAATRGRRRPEEKAGPARKGRGGAWVGGTVLGALVGAGACIGLWLGGIEPPEDWKTQLGLPAKQAGTAPAQPAGPGTQQPSFVVATEHLANGDLEKAQQAGIETVEAEKPEQLAARGQWRWHKYLQDQAKARAPLKGDDPAVRQAVDDLQKANTAEARLLMGQIQTMTGNLAEAEKIYQQGLMEFRGDRRFEAALIRLQLLREDMGAAQTRGEQPPPPVTALALVLFMLQDPAPVQAQPGGNAQQPEAGYDFWAALKLAREQKYAEAIAALKKAQQLHADRRLIRLGKAQNPDSDPTEEIFLRASKELLTYWELKEKLKGGGYLAADQKDPLQAATRVLADAEESKKVKQVADRLIAEKVIEQQADVVKGVDQLLTDRKTDATRITDLTTKLTEAGKQVTELTTMLTAAKKTGEDLSTRLKESTTREADLKKSLDTMTTLVDEAVRELKATRHLDPAADRGKLLEGVQEAVRMAALKDPEGTIRNLRQEVALLKEKNVRDVTLLTKKAQEDLERLDQTRKTEIKKLEDTLAQRWEPAEMLPVWLAALQERGSGDLPGRALMDAGRVAASETAPAEAKAQALVIQGLAQRNQARYADAAASLTRAREVLPADSPWHKVSEVALREAANPAEYYGQRAQDLYNEGKTEQALAALEQTLAIVPVKEPLLARRALLLIEQAVKAAGGRPPFNDPALAQARKDALEADRAGLAEGAFALGRLAELTGQRDEAVARYREALKRHPALDEAGARYRVALARVLSRPEAGWMPAPPKAEPKPPVGEQVGLRTRDDVEAMLKSPDLLVALVALMLQAPWEQPTPDDLEAQKLADEILKAPANTVPFESRAQALAIKGLWSQALLTYVEGLQRYLRQDHAQGLLMLVQNHPALKRPDSLKVANPLEAEREYGIGLRHYFAGRYPEAEQHLLRAVELFDEDARYFYFLGLARLAQNKRDAYEDFTQGARLERQNQPSRAAVSAALERVQGPVRQILNEARIQTQ